MIQTLVPIIIDIITIFDSGNGCFAMNRKSSEENKTTEVKTIECQCVLNHDQK